ncbi:MAG: CHRD domain-containing protein [Gammaproteobacteria bacterium]|nr:CHRD domain-containing protein [Gammaproteobacteria bacterium]
MDLLAGLWYINIHSTSFPAGEIRGQVDVVSTPTCDIQLNQSSYVDGDTVTADVFRIANLTAASLAMEWKVWLGVPGVSPIEAVNVGADGSIVLPAGTDEDFGPLLILPVTADLSPGSYELSCRLLDPVTGELLAEDLNVFEIQAPTYDIGGTGPAGGIVFYTTDGGLHGLEAAPVDQGEAPWGCSTTFIEGADGFAIGTGAQNTLDVLDECGNDGIAAQLVDEYSLNGYSDWFLPALGELWQMYATIGQGHGAPHGNVGNFRIGYYWSSTQGDYRTALANTINSTALIWISSEKTYIHNVRAVRAF